MRKLASVVRVESIEPIHYADEIEIVKIAGWQVVAKKGKHSPGELAVYLEIDSIPPDTEVFSWLWQKKGETGAPRPANFRIQTKRIRGVTSQGVLLSMAEIPELQEIVGFTIVAEHLTEGDDLTETLGVTKWEPPQTLKMGNARGQWPGFAPKTDEMRVQNVGAVLDEMFGKPYVMTLKYDGTSATYGYIIDEFHACSRNQSVSEGDNTYWNLAKKYDIPTILANKKHLVIQGEAVGPGIQHNRLGLMDTELRVFNIYDQIDRRYLDHDRVVAFCLEHDLLMVKVIEEGDFFNETLQSLLAKAEGKYEGTPNEREGLVVRPRNEMPHPLTPNLDRLSFKVISNKFLLKGGD